jgi:5-methylcytosine-specific restriction endonuclease McrA
MPNDPYYRSKEWRLLRAKRLAFDQWQCVIPGCNQRATIVDHVKSRRDGGRDELGNLRSLCTLHDHQMKERSNRARGFAPSICDQNGMPTDRDHPWFRKIGGAGKNNS